MQESCYCGRTGEIQDRRLVFTDDGTEALECTECGHLEYLEWLPEDARQDVFGRVQQGQPTAA